ncbi:MAG: SPOR domain-containing protein [Burkholderiales bacterium]
MADTQDVQQLKRRARRRLVGAIALVLLLVIVPPMIMDLEPRPVTSDLTVEIPSQASGQVRTPPPASPAPSKAPMAPTERAAETAASPPRASAGQPDRGTSEKVARAASKAEPKPAPNVEEKARSDNSESRRTSPLATATVDPRVAKDAQRAESALKGEAFVVPLGAYADPDNVKQLQAKLARAGVKSYTESVKAGASAQTRVAAGPYATRDEAERARQKLASLKGLGVVPGTITTR